MKTIAHVSHAMQTILGPIADQLGWETCFTQRQSKLSGSAFVQALVFSLSFVQPFAESWKTA
jgi:hypothetical protein